MSKMVKELIQKDLHARYAEADSAMWVEFANVDGNTTNEFRRELRKANMRLEIVKTALFRRAVSDAPLKALGEHMTGPSAVVTGGESAIDIAKLLDEWLPKIEGLKLRGAVLEGEYIGEDRVDTVSKMPSKRDLQARVVRQVLSPGSNLAGAMLGPGGVIAGCLKGLIEKLEGGDGEAEAA